MYELASSLRLESLKGFLPRDADALRSSGQDVGVALGHYLVWLGSKAKRIGASKLYFLSREGAWFAGHYARLRNAHPDGGSWPIPVTLAVSRRSTFLPSLSRVDHETLDPLLAQYPGVLSSTLLQSLGLDLSVLDPCLGFATKTLPLDRPWAEAGVAEAILSNASIAVELEHRRSCQRKALLRYLGQEGFTDAKPLIVADIGWRGTIQNNLARILPDRHLIGFYLALFPPFSPAPPNTEKYGFILHPTDSKRLARRLRFSAPFEFVASGEAQSTLEYEIEAGAARPITEGLSVAPFETPAFQYFQKAVSFGIDTTVATQIPIADLARKRLLQMLETPPISLVNLFFLAWRDDRYGAGVMRRGAARLKGRRIIAALASRRVRRAVGLELNDSGWPWGLMLRDVPIAASLLRRVILGLDVRL